MFQTISDVFVKHIKPAPTTSAPVEARRRAVTLGIDVPLLLVIATLLIFGVLMVYSASWDYSFLLFNSANYIFTRQVLWLILGIGAAVALTFMDYHWWRRLAVPAMAIAVLSLVAVLFISDVRHGAVRTLMGGSIQPSELAKLVTVIYLAVWLYSKQEYLSDINFGLLPLAGILGTLGGLIFVQPDLSAVITILFLGGTLFFLAGGDLRQIGIMLLVAVLVGWLIVVVNKTGGERVASYLVGLKDPTNASYHVQRSLEAFVNGGWLGVGIGNARTKLTGLPVPPTDSIFAVVGEETGVLGSTALVVLYVILLWRGLGIARRAPDQLGTLLAAGLSLWIAMEALVNMAVMLNLLPFAGNALPFISAGGSNLVVSLAAIGILMNISRLSIRVKENEGRSFIAVVDLRGRNRRRRVSRSRRATSSDE
jgi:cell division protein FtsW